MRRFFTRPALLVAALALLAAACGGDSTADSSTTSVPGDSSSTTSTTVPPVATSTTEAPVDSSTSSTTTSTTQPADPPLVVQGDRNETVEAFQFLINCNGFGDLEVDGAYGPATQGAIDASQVNLGRPATGVAGEQLLAELSRGCAQKRRIDGDGEVIVVGNTSPEDPEQFSIALLAGSTLDIVVTPAAEADVAVKDPDGAEMPSDGQRWTIDTTQDYTIEVITPQDAVTFTLTLTIAAAAQTTGDWILETNGINYRGTKLALGDDADTVINRIFDFLGHGVRGVYDEFDTGWYAITDPQDLGLRGILIEGLAFLFYGPDPVNTDTPETLARVRFVGPTLDAAGEPRPDDYVTTAEGITVGDTLADLKAAYGGGVSAGSNANEHYYRYSDGGGVLCFYFGAAAPDDFDPIIEIATQCRS